MIRVFFTLALVLCLLGCNTADCSVGDEPDAGESTATSTAAGVETDTPSTLSKPDCPFVSQCNPLDVLQGKKDCDDDDPYTIDRCIEAPLCGGLCAHIPGPCDGLDPHGVQIVVCDDGEACTSDRCGINECLHLPSADGTACPTGTCQSGACAD